MLEKLKPFFIQQAVPTVYDDSLTWLELVEKFQEKVNEAIDYINTSLKGKLNEVIKDRNETIKTAINNTIDSNSEYTKRTANAVTGNFSQLKMISETDKGNIIKLNSNFTKVKEHEKEAQEYANSVSSTLYNGTYKVVKLSSYDGTTKTLNLKESKTDLVSSIGVKDMEELTTPADFYPAGVEDWTAPEKIITTIEEVD